MSLSVFCSLLFVWLVSLNFILFSIWREFLRVRFNFNVFFSLLFFLTFYFGFPLTSLLVYCFDVRIVKPEFLLQTLLIASSFYFIYYVSYKTRLCTVRQERSEYSLFAINRVEAYLICGILTLLALITLAIFFMRNGFLLFRLHAYNEVFSSEVSSIALKRFFYFFIPAMLVIFFLQPKRNTWIFFLISTVTLGLLTYTIVGGTRANIIIAFSLFLFIGIIRGWITLWYLIITSVFCIIGMFWLALCRYNLDVSGTEAIYTFLCLTRDTFSPWENLALLLQNYDKIHFQGLAPIIRDFYVYIPLWIWPERPSLVLNSANYFTWEILNNHSGLAISPTLLGSLLVMGGIIFIPFGAIIVGLIIKWFDWLYDHGRYHANRYTSAILQSFYFSAVFNIIVLIREGLDAFISRVVFFFLMFSSCVVLAKLIFLLLNNANLIRPRQEIKEKKLPEVLSISPD